MRTLVFATLVACTTAPPIAPRPPPIASAPNETVRTDAGVVRGIRTASAFAWRGIPYAAPPIGPLRWRPPAPVAPWPGVRNATGFGYACMQAGSSHAPGGSALGSEDCLTLNVWRPANATGALPVMVFVHGGYFTWGASDLRRAGVELYNGEQLAVRGGVIVVTINYRLGPFGFLAHPALADEDPHRSTGNYGLYDQLAALHWVQRNIAAFGGDPARVTLFGQSAGAISGAVMLASPLARGLISGVIMHSGSGNARPRAQADRGGIELAHRLDCERATSADTIACLRSASPSAIATGLEESFAPGGVRFGPVVDDYLLPARPIEIVQRGAHNHVPLIVSTTTDEFSTMVDGYLDGPIATADDYAAMVERRFPQIGKDLVARYPASAYPTPRAALVALMSDENFICPSDWLADAAATHQREPVYRFVFGHSYAGSLAALGAGHGLDLFMVFRNLPPPVRLSDEERALSDQLLAAWSQFAHTGTLPWPVRASGAAEQLDQTLHPVASHTAACTALRELMRRR